MSPPQAPTTQGVTSPCEPFTFEWEQPKLTPHEMRELRKREKRAAKQARATRAVDPEHVASKTDMISKSEQALEAERESERVRIRSRERFQEWCRRRMMDEIDTDGEEC